MKNYFLLFLAALLAMPAMAKARRRSLGGRLCSSYDYRY
jgi:hypothetical protein